MSEHLYDNDVIEIHSILAEKVGINGAAFLSRVHYWSDYNCKANKNYHDGRYWTYNSYEDWQKQFPWISDRTIKSIVDKLEKEGYLLTGVYNKMKYDRTKWYAVNYDKVNELYGDKQIWIQPTPIDTSYQTNGESVNYEEYIKSEAWALKRNQRMRKDHFKCAHCGSTNGLTVHHITYKNLGHENMNDLITLCWECHKKEHQEKY